MLSGPSSSTLSPPYMTYTTHAVPPAEVVFEKGSKNSFPGICTAECKTRMKPLTRCTAFVTHGEPADKIEFVRELGEGEEGIIIFDDMIKRKSSDAAHRKFLENLVTNLNERFEKNDIAHESCR